MAVTIAQAASAAEVGVETIRYYERRGLIRQPPKPTSGFREYDAETILRLRFIRQAQTLGFSLGEIEELLSLRSDPNADCTGARTQASLKRDEVDHKIADLKRIRTALDTLIANCPGGGTLSACTIIEAIEQASTERAGPESTHTPGENRTPRHEGLPAP